MLRIHFIQHWFNLADLACDEALYDSASLRRFVGIDLGREPVPDATTLLKFRRLLMAEKKRLTQNDPLQSAKGRRNGHSMEPRRARQQTLAGQASVFHAGRLLCSGSRHSSAVHWTIVCQD